MVPGIKHRIPRGRRGGLNLILFLLYNPTPPSMSVDRFLFSKVISRNIIMNEIITDDVPQPGFSAGKVSLKNKQFFLLSQGLSFRTAVPE